MPRMIETVPARALTAADVAVLRQDLADYHAIYAPVFPRREQREQSQCYLAGLLSDEHRKSVARMVLHLRGADRNAVRTAQMFVGQGRWPDDALLAQHWCEVVQTLGHPDGVVMVDGRDCPKQGHESVGVARQYCGELGKKANCQAGVFLSYASDRGATLIHRQLYLPPHGVEDPAWADRRPRCGVPPDPIFQTKPQLAAALVAEVVAAGRLPVRWVTCDEGYGQDPAFLDGLVERGLGYLAEVPHTTRVWLTRPPREVSPSSRGHPRLPPEAPRSQAVRDVAAPLPASVWTYRPD